MSKKIDNVFIALDDMSREEIMTLLKKPELTITHVKIGLELFLKYGRSLVEEVAALKFKVFLDLKLHDIPNTVYGAIRSLEKLPVDFLTLHLTGGENMLLKAIEARNQFLPNTKLLGVSFLTSLGPGDLYEMFAMNPSPEENREAFKRLFILASKTKIDGIVCSGHELEIVKEVNDKILCVTPGIRFESDEVGDQKRVMTPKAAFAAGANYLVMGRSLTKAQDLAEKLKELK